MRKILIFTLLLFTISSFGKRIYSIPKSDFIIQFSDPIKFYRIYCYNENNKKVWLSINENTQLTLNLNDDKKIVLLLQSIKYANGLLNGVEFNIWFPRKKISTFKIENVKTFTVEKNYFESEYTFFNLDSISKVSKFKNDSLKSAYQSGEEYVLYLKNKTKNDTLILRQNSCLHLEFKDGIKIIFGIVKKITQDSITVTNSLNENMAKTSKIKFETYKYSVSEISQLNLLKGGGFTFSNLKINDFDVVIKKVNKNKLFSQNWYAINPRNGKINLYWSWLTNRGYIGITEINGKAIWYEGENTE